MTQGGILATPTLKVSINYHQDCLLRLARRGKLKVKKDKQVVSLVPTMEEFELIATAIKVLKVCQVQPRHSNRKLCQPSPWW